MIYDLPKLVGVAFMPIRGRIDNGNQSHQKRCVNRTNALLGQGSVPVSRGFVMTSRFVRRMKDKVLCHDFRP